MTIGPVETQTSLRYQRPGVQDVWRQLIGRMTVGFSHNRYIDDHDDDHEEVIDDDPCLDSVFCVLCTRPSGNSSLY